MSARNEVVITACARTPFGKFGGAMKNISSLDLGVMAVREALSRLDKGSDLVDELYFGTCVLSENALETNVLARQAVLKAGLRPEVLSLTIDRACCSSMTALHMGYRSIRSGEADVVVAVGAENMSRTPFLAPDVRWGRRLGPAELVDPMFALGYKGWNPVAVDAGEVALEYNVDREEQDRWALLSQQRYSQALENGRFEEEIFPVRIEGRKGSFLVEQDEQPRPDTTLEELAGLPLIYGSPTVTSGNAPGLNTGAAALVLMSREKAEELGIEFLAIVKSIGSVALEPHQIASVPAPAIEKALEKAGGIDLEAVNLIEINEAFAAMPLVSTKILAGGEAKKLEDLRSKTNVNGGAIAIGHPVGASGARLVMTLAFELRRRGGGLGVAAICGGLAQGDSVLIEV